MASIQSNVANICRFALLGIIVSFSCTTIVHAEEPVTIQSEIGLEEQISSYIKNFRLLSASGKYDQDHMASLLEQGRLLSLRPGGIETFRKLDDLELISEVVRVIAGGSRGVRISGSLLLANIVDNTTLCAVINALADEKLDQFARFNFIQLLKVVSGYANRDNTKWIDQVLRKNSEFLKTERDSEKTTLLIRELSQSLGDSANPSYFNTRYPREYHMCLTLPYIAELESSQLMLERKTYTLYLHTNLPNEKVANLTATLESMGFTIGGTDAQQDVVGGRGVDFSKNDPNGELYAAAATIAAVINQELGVIIGPRPQTATERRTFGLWF